MLAKTMRSRQSFSKNLDTQLQKTGVVYSPDNFKNQEHKKVKKHKLHQKSVDSSESATKAARKVVRPHLMA